MLGVWLNFCMTMWGNVKEQVSIQGLETLCHCVRSALKAHYSAALCELLVFTISRKSAITAENAAPTDTLRSDLNLEQRHRCWKDQQTKLKLRSY